MSILPTTMDLTGLLKPFQGSTGNKARKHSGIDALMCPSTHLLLSLLLFILALVFQAPKPPL